MNQTLETEYFEWLKHEACKDSRNYQDLFYQMHEKEFVWIIPNDDNRINDGMDLRSEFLGVREAHQMFKGVSVLEILVGLSRRMAWAAGGDSRRWAWQLVCNLKLDRMSDPVGIRREDRIDGILEDLIWRNYQPDGVGGFFPLANAEADQTKVELWYQMSAYINETQEP